MTPDLVPCPANNCTYGQVFLREWPEANGGSSVVLAGNCDSCGFPSVYCQECENVTVLIDGDPTRCDGCEAVYQQGLDRKGLLETFRRVS